MSKELDGFMKDLRFQEVIDKKKLNYLSWPKVICNSDREFCCQQYIAGYTDHTFDNWARFKHAGPIAEISEGPFTWIFQTVLSFFLVYMSFQYGLNFQFRFGVVVVLQRAECLPQTSEIKI